MTLRLEKNDGSGWQAVNLETARISGFRLQIAYSHPATLTFVVHQPQHTLPIAAYAGIRFWDDAATDPDGVAFDSNNPAFLGFVEDIDPGEQSNEIKYTCYDPTLRAANLIPVMSTSWTSPTTQGLGAVPRLVFNPAVDNDDDWQFARGAGYTVGQMIAVILSDAQLPLETVFASPGTGDPYEATDLDGLNYEPQEKIVFTGEPIRSAIMRLIDDGAPEWRMLFYPGQRKWRFGDIGQSPQVTYTLNDFRDPGIGGPEHPVLKLNLDRSLDGRYTAVKIYGPEATENRTVTLSGGGLYDVDQNGGPILDSFGAGGHVFGKSRYQIIDTARRRMGRLLPEAIFAPLEEVRIGPNAWTQFSMWTRTPTFLVKYPASTQGSDAWQTCTGWFYDSSTGIVDFKGRYVYRYNASPTPGDPNYENPSDVMLIYPSYIEPLSVRVPSSGYEGTASAQSGLQNERKIYDESLAVGFLYGTPVTSATRVAKFQVLAQAILNTKKDILYHGGMTLEGLDYTFHRLDRRVNVAGVNGDGNPIATGWETMRGIVTDVEYDFEDQTTIVNFSSDQSELLGFDPERIKQELRVGAAQIQVIVRAETSIRNFTAYTEWGTPYIAQSVSTFSQITPVAVDPYFGTIDPLEG